jgi:hypothetical protein
MTLIASATLLVTAFIASEATAASSCNGDGWLCFYDYGTSSYGNVQYSNRYWSDFGWNNRADKFKNQGNTHDVCLYDYTNYNFSGDVLLLFNNATWYYGFSNKVSSNKWIRNASSVYDCD